MISGRIKILISFFTCLLIANINFSYGQEPGKETRNQQALDKGIDLLERYFFRDSTWYVVRPATSKSVKGIINFITKDPLDSILISLNKSLEDTSKLFVYRLPKNVPDSLSLRGFYPKTRLNEDLEQIKRSLSSKYLDGDISVPMHLVTGIEDKAGVITPGQGRVLFERNIYKLPDSLRSYDVIPDSLIRSTVDFNRLQKLDSIREQYIEQKRLEYNDSVIWVYRDSVIRDYRQRMFDQEFGFLKKNLTDSVNNNNDQILKKHNASVVAAVNDSISLIIEELAEYADYIDTVRIYMTNLVGDESSILLQNNNQYFSRVWLKNEQNDSLRVAVKNLDKYRIQMLIDDGVTISRFKPKQTKDFDFASLNKTVTGLTGVGEKYRMLTPWRIGGDGTVGFSQTYLENWKKGGQSALSLHIILKGFANYSSSDNKVKWENSGEIRNGWIRPGGNEAELQKNDDKFEITSRFGLSAFKKWYYSSEFNYETQFFNGYKYPTSKNPDPISSFMSPARTFFKVGLDYKPNKNFSLFLSPITLKNVFVKDTARIDQTKFGIDADKRGFWEPGMNTDLSYRKDINPNISYQTKYKMFINYRQPFNNLDINWENTLVMQLTDHINMRLMIHMIYDDDVLFPVYNANDEKIGEEPKIQLKEFINIGFTYKINRQVKRTVRKD
jgi:hypothetical protein